MTLITGNEPRHWHDENGQHRMPDPRRLPGWKPAHCDKDERAYWEHLDAHDTAETAPRGDDSPAVVALFEAIGAHERAIALVKDLVKAIRHKENQERTVSTRQP